MPLCLYKVHIRRILADQSEAQWLEQAAVHHVPFPYSDLAGSSLRAMLPRNWVDNTWASLSGHRSLCRLRAGLLDLSHRGGKRSAAAVRECIFCAKKTRAPYIHVLGECAVSCNPSLPASWSGLTPRDRALAFLSAGPVDAHFTTVSLVAKRIHDDCEMYWREKLAARSH